jgi:hypothetical protein
MRKTKIWFEIKYKVNNNVNRLLKDQDRYSGSPLPSEKDVFKTAHYLAISKECAERWGCKKFGKIYGVEKVSIDDLYKDKENEYNRMISKQQPLGLKIAKGVYESDIDLTEMLLGKPKRDTHVVKVEKKNKWDLISETE